MLTTKKEKELAFLSLLPKSVRDSDLETFHQTFTGSLFWMKSQALLFIFPTVGNILDHTGKTLSTIFSGKWIFIFNVSK